MKILIATHGMMASGVKSTLSIFTDTSEITTIDAYVDDTDYTPEIQKFISRINEGEIAIIFTDLIGGSVNQKVLALNNKSNVKIISGFNISLILEIMLSKITSENEILEILKAARNQMQLIKSEHIDVNDESDDSFLE